MDRIQDAEVWQKAAALFSGWDEAMIWSCLEGHMGYMIADQDENPESAMIDIGDFCFFAGKPERGLLDTITGGKLLIPGNEQWQHLIRDYYKNQANQVYRYAIKKEPDVFDTDQLQAYVRSLPADYECRLMNREIFHMARAEDWSVDLCSQFNNYEDYKKRAVGVAVLHQGKLVAGASPYAVYNAGIEIEIDTKPEYRQRGLATACGAALILECQKRSLYPSWDAHDLRSVALAEKLGYHRDQPYVTFEVGFNGTP